MRSASRIFFLLLLAPVAAWVCSCTDHPTLLSSTTSTATTTRSTASTQPLGVTDLDRQPADPFAGAASRRATVLLFVADMCPISNNYAPEINRLVDEYAKQGIAFCLVYPDPSLAPRDARNHYRGYAFKCPAVLDPKQTLARRAEATVTPEAAVYLSNGQRVYRGRINDRWMAFAKARRVVTSNDLRDVLEAIAHDQPVPPRTTPAIGCPIVP